MEMDPKDIAKLMDNLPPQQDAKKPYYKPNKFTSPYGFNPNNGNTANPQPYGDGTSDSSPYHIPEEYQSPPPQKYINVPQAPIPTPAPKIPEPKPEPQDNFSLDFGKNDRIIEI
jgi:hypothetical protein